MLRECGRNITPAWTADIEALHYLAPRAFFAACAAERDTGSSECCSRGADELRAAAVVSAKKWQTMPCAGFGKQGRDRATMARIWTGGWSARLFKVIAAYRLFPARAG